MQPITAFKILSHACLLVTRGDISLIIDPWLIGSCYWRSWWNYPEPDINEEELNKVTHVLISHIHWDHWHGKTLKRFFKNCQFLIPQEPKTRSYDDLVNLRLGEVELIKHGQTYNLGNNIEISIYQFGLYQNDSAIIIKTPEVKILNSNDAKIAGWPLKQVIKKHGPFDFALRSHSTANARACISIENANNDFFDDNEHYSRAFKLFMDAVKPKYAVPFASNHCHLHKDTYHFNKLITNPIKLRDWLSSHGGLESSEFKIMLPGSSWHSQDGFYLPGLETFNNLEQKLEIYHQSKLPILTDYYELEKRQTLDNKTINKHEKHLQTIPWLFKTLHNNTKVSYKIVTHNGNDYFFAINYQKNKLLPISEEVYTLSDIKIIWPILVFKQAVGLNMYAHAFISKRVKFIVNTPKNLRKLNRFISCLEKIEHEVFPLRLSYLLRVGIAYLYRWRELFLYLKVCKYIICQKKSLPEIEEVILSESKVH